DKIESQSASIFRLTREERCMSPILFRNSAILDPVRSELSEGCDVLIEGELIREVSLQPIRSASANVLDIGGRVLMPGLIDAHVHVAAVTTNLAELARIPPSLVAAQAKYILEAML